MKENWNTFPRKTGLSFNLKPEKTVTEGLSFAEGFFFFILFWHCGRNYLKSHLEFWISDKIVQCLHLFSIHMGHKEQLIGMQKQLCRSRGNEKIHELWHRVRKCYPHIKPSSTQNFLCKALKKMLHLDRGTITDVFLKLFYTV